MKYSIKFVSHRVIHFDDRNLKYHHDNLLAIFHIVRYEILLANCHGDTLNFYRQNVSPGGKQTL